MEPEQIEYLSPTLNPSNKKDKQKRSNNNTTNMSLNAKSSDGQIFETKED